MTRQFWVITGIVTCTLQGCASSGTVTRTAPVMEFGQRNAATTDFTDGRTPPPATEQPPADVQAAPGNEAPTPAPRTNAPIATHPAALALLNEAMRQEKSGELEVAAAKLERALRIEPRNPMLWHQLAALRLRQGQTQLAANLAQKSNSYTTRDTELAALNQRIIDRAAGR